MVTTLLIVLSNRISHLEIVQRNQPDVSVRGRESIPSTGLTGHLRQSRPWSTYMQGPAGDKSNEAPLS